MRNQTKGHSRLRGWDNGQTRVRMLILTGILLLSISACAPTGASKLVVLVRHAERAAEPRTDPVLTAQGVDRARELGARLADTRIDHIITSQLARTRLTAKFAARDRGLQPEIVSVEGDVAAHIAAVVAAVRSRPDGEAILVVGHSNTIPAIMRELGGPDLPDLAGDAYSDLFVLLIDRNGQTRTIRASFD